MSFTLMHRQYAVGFYDSSRSALGSQEREARKILKRAYMHPSCGATSDNNTHYHSITHAINSTFTESYKQEKI